MESSVVAGLSPQLLLSSQGMIEPGVFERASQGGLKVKAWEYLQAKGKLRQWRDEALHGLMEGQHLDAIILPTVSMTAPLLPGSEVGTASGSTEQVGPGVAGLG